MSGTDPEDTGGRIRVRLYLHDKAGDPRVPIRLRAWAIGYEESSQSVVPAQRDSASEIEIRLRRAGSDPLTQVYLRLNVNGSEHRPSGVFSCVLTDTALVGSTVTLSLAVENGMGTHPVPLPLGEYALTMTGVAGSAALWRRPLRDPNVRFQLERHGQVVVDLPCSGVPLRVAPRGPGGIPLAEYWIAVSSEHGSAQCATWQDLISFEECSVSTEHSGRLFWIPAAAGRLTVAKSGYTSLTRRVDLAGQVSGLDWSPGLDRLPAR